MSVPNRWHTGRPTVDPRIPGGGAILTSSARFRGRWDRIGLASRWISGGRESRSIFSLPQASAAVVPDQIDRNKFDPNQIVQNKIVQNQIVPNKIDPNEIDPLYLFACRVEWSRRAEPSAAWELLAAAQSPNQDTRAHARALLASSEPRTGGGEKTSGNAGKSKQNSDAEAAMNTPYGLEIIENCAACSCRKTGFFCCFSGSALKAIDQASHRSTMPAGAILFVEGQLPCGVWVLCSGKVNLSTTSREGKVLMIKTAEPGEALGLSAAISGESYEMTAETVTPCQLDFVDRTKLIELLENYSEVGLHAAQSLSRDFQSAYRDMHDLVLARSSAGKLARLLLSRTPDQMPGADEVRLRSVMTHEEMAQRIGSSRETVTRLLSDLKKKQLIRLDGATLVIRDRPALEALAV